ncbi:ribonuclease III [Arsenicicoccus sp. oral taxon 190]|uniref:ribonuclease III n=1 Tax=Arsenicicoccus sp. oral taxon 190 TaxID=1658671 RepID=UPI0009E1BC0F
MTSRAATGPDGTQQRPVGALVDHLAQVVGERVDESLLLRALTHRSYAYEHGGLPHNERLEFLGDSVLGLVVTDTLYRQHPREAEGQLAKLRAAVVNMRALAQVGRDLELGAYLLLGRGEESTGGRDKTSILADTTEAVIGAVYLSCGMTCAATLVHHLLDPLMASSARLGAALDWKTSLQELTSTLGIGVPEYRLTDEGPDHLKVFTARAVVGEETLGEGVGRSKKEAEQKAAEVAWTALDERAAEPATPEAARASTAEVAGVSTPESSASATPEAQETVATSPDGTPSGDVLERT